VFTFSSNFAFVRIKSARETALSFRTLLSPSLKVSILAICACARHNVIDDIAKAPIRPSLRTCYRHSRPPGLNSYPRKRPFSVRRAIEIFGPKYALDIDT
jgi:hypothetical protein